MIDARRDSVLWRRSLRLPLIWMERGLAAAIDVDGMALPAETCELW
jgi:hypothetical protein